jgi:hypothetical protein
MYDLSFYYNFSRLGCQGSARAGVEVEQNNS